MTRQEPHTDGPMARASRRARCRLGRDIARDERGVTSIEFALLALPFLSMIFMILELAVVFYINAGLDHATAQATRLVRTGQLQMASNDAGDQLEDFVEEMCFNMSAFADCDKKLRVDLVRSSTNRFEPNMLPAPPHTAGRGGSTAGVPLVAGGAVQRPNSDFQATCPGDVVMVRAEFYHPLTISSKITRLANTDDNIRVITSVTAFRNEPYPAQAGSSCGTSSTAGS